MTTQYYFKSKENYLAFKAAWANAVNDERSKSTIEKSHDSAWVKKGWITSAHVMLYNIIRGKDPLFGFTPYQKHSKVKGGVINMGATEAYNKLTRMKDYAFTYAKKPDSWNGKYVKKFLEPFGDTFTAKDLASINFTPKIDSYHCEFGVGRKLADLICEGEIAPKTCIELRDIANELKTAKAKEDREMQDLKLSAGIMGVA